MCCESAGLLCEKGTDLPVKYFHSLINYSQRCLSISKPAGCELGFLLLSNVRIASELVDGAFVSVHEQAVFLAQAFRRILDFTHYARDGFVAFGVSITGAFAIETQLLSTNVAPLCPVCCELILPWRSTVAVCDYGGNVSHVPFWFSGVSAPRPISDSFWSGGHRHRTRRYE